MKAAGGGPTLRNPIRRGLSACCASATSGEVAAPVHRRIRNSRRLIDPHRTSIVSGRTSYVRFGSKSRHLRRKSTCPLILRKRTCAVQLGMSALCQKRTSGTVTTVQGATWPRGKVTRISVNSPGCVSTSIKPACCLRRARAAAVSTLSRGLHLFCHRAPVEIPWRASRTLVTSSRPVNNSIL